MQTYTNWESSRRPTKNWRFALTPIEPPRYSPGELVQRPSIAGVFTRSVALISSGVTAWRGPGAPVSAGALLRTGTSVRSQVRDQSDIAKTVRGLNTGPRNDAETEASICVPTEATFGVSGNRSHV